ncbi:hypothetical protein VCHA53P481_100099 [Vibrio chagasii]|nr:hypothetical protein VCHA32O87_100098 [Vibrio chagasii]CAH6919631.1 hypothetical protein VCHA43P284_100080 [Vibrio chagasii]CAH6932830.1 hypothetical protein VCHA53P481_100099 [Vibrio chagasii]
MSALPVGLHLLLGLNSDLVEQINIQNIKRTTTDINERRTLSFDSEL